MSFFDELFPLALAEIDIFFNGDVEIIMEYSIGEMAEKTGLSVYALRFYEKEGLLPFVRKNGSGKRVFSEDDLAWLGLVICLKETGMTLRAIRCYIDWLLEGDGTLLQRLEMFRKQRDKIMEQIRQFSLYRQKIEYKIRLYERALEVGSLKKAEDDPAFRDEGRRLFQSF